MELLTIRHTDFTMTIECGKFDAIWAKAKRNVGEQGLFSTYSWSEGVSSVVRLTEDGEQEIEKGQTAPAIFFDNADYPIWVEFQDYVKDAQFGSELQGENEKFTFRRQILAGFLNYGNEIGRSEIHIIYKTKEGTNTFTFSFEVLSTKLDYHEHWRSILEDIEAEYRMLSLDYMRRTFHGFTPDTNGETPEIVWWSVFGSEQEKFIRACKSIIERPRHRLHGQESYKRADKLTIVSCGIENELAEHRKECGHLYRVEEQIQTNDTQENRFLKFTLGQITSKYDTLKRRVEGINTVSDIKKAEMSKTLSSLQHLVRNPFFRTVGRYKGMNQESMVLQKASGYSQVYRTWNLLRRGYSLYDGLYRLQTKDIATLYEIWCFIEVSHIVKEQLHLSDEDVDHRNRMEMNGVFTWELGKGEHSRILFKKDNVELAELVYNPKSTERENSSVGMKDLVVPTVPQKPDIVLQLTKNDLQQGMKMTYLFDAKYRIADKIDDIPAAEPIIELTDDEGCGWLALECYPTWNEPHGKGDIYKKLWYQVRSCIINEDELPLVYEWASKQNFGGRWMPECSDRYELFYREYYWSPAYKYFDIEGLTKRDIYDRKANRFITHTEVTTIGYLWEAEEDHSKETAFYCLMPSKQLFDGLGMQYGDEEGAFLDKDGKTICFDAGAVELSKNYLLVRKKPLLDYLKTNHKKILWYVLGEKNIIGLHGYNKMPNLPMWLVVSGTYTLDEEGKVMGCLRATNER